MSPIALFPFRYRDTRTGKWTRARYRATREEIAARYAEKQLTGEAELRADEPVQMFNPALPMLVNGMRADVAPEMRPAIDACERFLAAMFLRRYVTWCARSPPKTYPATQKIPPSRLLASAAKSLPHAALRM